jgi:carotenoid cleavage dioxygenase-like enzyme
MSESVGQWLSSRRQVPQPIDMATEPHLRGVFAPQMREVDSPDLVIEGELPAEIEGDFIRNGPNPRFSPLGGYLYPLDGDGMLHRVQFRDGRARYTNRFVRTPAVVAEEAAGRALWPGVAGFGKTPGRELVGPVLAHTEKNLPSINVVRHAGRLLALAESAPPFTMSADLGTLESETFYGMLPAGITAHPKVDPSTGEMVVFCYSLHAPYLTWSIIDRDGVPVRAQTPVDGIDRAVMIHDMALTRSYVVLVLGPFYFDIAGAMSTGSIMSWEPDNGSRVVLIPRDGGPARWLSTDAFWLWHTANAYDAVAADGTTRVVLDYVHWTAPNGFAHGVPTTGSLARLTLDPATGAVLHETLVDRGMEFPRIDDRLLTGAHRKIATALKTGPRDDLPSGDADTLGWYDAATGAFDLWPAGDLAVGEQTFVPRPGDRDPSHGWWVTFATDRTDLTSRLLVLAAADPASGPVATILLPQRVPLGLHGAWLPAAP